MRRTLPLLALVAASTAPTQAPGQAAPAGPRPLAHPPVERVAAAVDPGPDSGYRFVVLGDQRALSDEERSALIRAVDATAARDRRILFIIDTGDIVDQGEDADQFDRLARLVAPVQRLPYLVGVGNHEVDNNRPGPARQHVATLLSTTVGPLSPQRLWYRKVVGPVRFLFLDSNDLVYGDRGDREGSEAPDSGSRAAEQFRWLAEELADTTFPHAGTTVLVMHHPFVQSSERHRGQARALWHYRYGGRTLPDILADGGVDLVLVGHTHTYERFTLARRDGRRLAVVNISGRPLPSFLFFGAGKRRARDLRGREASWLAGHGWSALDQWRIVQEDAMLEDEANQFGVFTVAPDGSVTLEMHFLGRPVAKPPVKLN